MTVAAARTESLAVLSARLRSASNLPSPPAVAARLIDVADDPDLSMTKVVEILRIDPALTAKLLRLANSPLYARRRHIETLQQAVTLLGLDTVMTAALSLTLLSDTTAQSADVFRRQWSRSVYAAVSAQALAAHCPHVPAPDAFLAALLQDVGILALARLEPTLYADLVDTDHDALTAREHSVLGVDHAEAGAELLACWNLPSHVVGAVRQSHAATCEGSDPLENIGRVGEVAKLMSDAGLIVITAFIPPFMADRDMVRSMLPGGEFIEVFIDTPLAVAESRDVKGLYKKAREGKLKNFTGIDSPYEAPVNPEIHIDTTVMTPEAAAKLIVDTLLGDA